MKSASDASRNTLHGPPRGTEYFAKNAWSYDIGVYLVALAVLTVAMMFLHALSSGLSGSDEGSHFLNGYMIWSYLKDAPGQNPMTYATNFYIHYPKISIGHWPPLYYAFLASFFGIVSHTTFPFFVVNLVVGALPALLIARSVRQVLGLPWAVLAGISYVLIPITLNNTVRLMLDQAIAGLCLFGALLWSAYSKRPSLLRGFAYAFVTAAAILVKGNGWVLGVLPFFHIALTGRWWLLTDWRTYAAGILALLFVGVWTAATYKMSSNGFNYAWGFDYFLLAISTFLSAIYSSLGPLGVIASLIGIVGSVTSKDQPELKELGRTCLALILATIIFHCIVPVDLDSRYMSSAIPPLAIFMAIGVWFITQRWQIIPAPPWRVALPGSLALFCIPGMLFLHDRPVRFDLRMDLVATQIAKAPDGMVVVIDGSPGVEGAFTSELALRDKNQRSYVVRSSQLLAKSDFMGHRYTLRVNTPEAVLNLLDDISCSAVVVAEGQHIDPLLPHSHVLHSALLLPSSPFRLADTYEHLREDGHTYLYLRSIPMKPQPDAVKRVNYPDMAAISH